MLHITHEIIIQYFSERCEVVVSIRMTFNQSTIYEKKTQFCDGIVLVLIIHQRIDHKQFWADGRVVRKHPPKTSLSTFSHRCKC